MAARLWLACAPLERQHVPGGRHAPVRNAISHPARRFLSKNVGYRVLPTGRLEGFRLRVSWDVSWCTGGYGADESRCPRAERAALSSACNRSVLAKHNRTRVVGSRSDRQGRRYIRGGDAGGAGPGDTGPHVQARSSTPVREQYTRWGAVHPLGSRTPDRKGCIAYRSGVVNAPTRKTTRKWPHRRPPRTDRRQCERAPVHARRARYLTGHRLTGAAGRSDANNSPDRHAPRVLGS